MMAVAVGGAAGWRDELDRVRAVREPDLYVACNDTGVELEPLHAWCSVHPERLLSDGDNPTNRQRKGWTTLRREAGLSEDYVTWTHGDEPPADRTLKDWHDGSSGLLCVGAALEMGADEVVCVGIPMDDRPNHYRDGAAWKKHSRFRRGWTRKQERMRGKVYSMSGWTRELLGAPPWLDDMSEAA